MFELLADMIHKVYWTEGFEVWTEKHINTNECIKSHAMRTTRLPTLGASVVRHQMSEMVVLSGAGI